MMLKLFEKVQQLKARTKAVYIYGFGTYGHNVYSYLKRNGVCIDGFVVTKKCDADVADIPIVEIAEILNANVGIILGLGSYNSLQVSKFLDANNFNKNNIIDGGKELDNGGIRLGSTGMPVLEITTKVGCAVNCKYCPQSVFLSKYYENDKNRISMMSVDTFQKCVEKLPKEANLLFSGLVEPFLNPECMEMIKLGIEMGRVVDVYTTLTGLTIEKVKELVELPINYFILHVADRLGYAKIDTSEEYYDMLKILADNKKAGGGAMPFCNRCHAQAEPDPKVEEVFRGKVDIVWDLMDRAGNLKGDGLITKKQEKGRLSCSDCGEALNKNILLPDGTVLLCCMDFGMKHVLGNLLTQSYEEICYGKEMTMIREGLNGNEHIDILCRRCTHASAL